VFANGWQIGGSCEAAALIQAFYDRPVMSAIAIEARSGFVASRACRATDRLTRSGFSQDITGQKRNRVWAASEALAELDDLDRRIQAAMA